MPALRRWGPLALCAALVAVLLAWNPQVHDLAAHVFRERLFDRSGLTIWNGSWYQGHYTLTYSVLFPPLAALLGVQPLGALSAVVAVYLFDRLVRERWGDAAIWASVWFAVSAAVMFANGNITFALGAAIGLGALRGLQRKKAWLACICALLCTLASPLAGAFLGGVGLAIAIGAPSRRRAAIALAVAALLPAALLNLIFHEQGQQPFDFAAYLPIPLLCAGALFLIRDAPGERAFRIAVIGYALAATLFWLVPSPMGSNVTRLGMFFGGPLLLALVLAHRDSIRLRGPLTIVIATLTFGFSAYWQVDNAVREVAFSAGDPSTDPSYYAPLESWLHDHGGDRTRIEIPESVNAWEAAYVAPEFQLARGWLRQMDRARNHVFYEGVLTPERYLAWLHRTGVRYVALPDVDAQQYSRSERALILSQPAFLKPVWSSEHWQVFRVRNAQPLVSSDDGGRARIVDLEPDSVTLDVTAPGTFTVLVRSSPFWHVAEGEGCVGGEGDWTGVRAERAGPLQIENSFSLGRAWDSLIRDVSSC
jgi:hypothetical protein